LTSRKTTLNYIQNFMIKYNAIILPDKVFLADAANKEWHVADLDKGFLFDGQKALPTNKKGWYELPNLPKTVQNKISPPPLISSYKLRDGFVSTDKLPATVSADFFEYDDEEEEYLNGEIKGLYEAVLKQKEPYLENVEFEISTISHKNSNWKFVAAPPNVQNYLLDEITKHPALLQDEKCFLSKEESYKRIREFIKLNINPRVAYVSSDYDFHFEVAKKIPLHEKEKYQRNVKPFAKRPKYVDDYRLNRKVTVYCIIPDEKRKASYKNSDIAPQFSGENYEDLEINISNYLNDLINKINEPLKDCPHCKGRGVVLLGNP
jgi:hypothetical protein